MPTFNARPPVVKMYEDAACVRSMLDELIETESKDVICVLHSYGGVVGTEAIHESLGKKFRASKGLDGGVLGILYMAAFVLPLGTHLGTAFGGPLPPFIRIEVRSSFRSLNVMLGCANADIPFSSFLSG